MYPASLADLTPSYKPLILDPLRISGNPILLNKRRCDNILIGSAKSPGRTHYSENLWSMKIIGASTDIFFIVPCSGCLCKGVL